MHRQNTPAVILPYLAALALLGACGSAENDGPADRWVAERDTIGDTVVVRTVAGSVWGTPDTLEEDLAIGVLDGAPEYMFGSVDCMTVDRTGGVYVFDGQAPSLRYFDREGHYVRTLGRTGSGPGEYRDACLGLAVRSDGRVVMRDPANGRLNVYDSTGAPWASWMIASGLYTGQATAIDTADNLYLKILTEQPQRNQPWKVGLLHLDAAGQIVDTIPDPAIADAPTRPSWNFDPRKIWVWSPLGYMVVGVNADYRFELRRPERVIRVERSVETVPVLPDERDAYEQANAWIRKNQGRYLTAEIPPVAPTKPPYRGLYAGECGRIWVLRHVRAVKGAVDTTSRPDRPPPNPWREPTVFDVFEPDGTYLGEVHVPERTTLEVMRGDTVWGLRRGSVDEQYVVRLHLHHGGGCAAGTSPAAQAGTGGRNP